MLRVERIESSASKTSLHITFGHSILKCGVERGQEIFLADMCSVRPYIIADLLTVRRLDRAKTPDIKRLKKMR